PLSTPLPSSCRRPSPPEPYPPSLHDALPISVAPSRVSRRPRDRGCGRGGRRDDGRDRARRRRRPRQRPGPATRAGRGRAARDARSEEHTSELQSPYDLVCRLLLEKKKKKKKE